jgi:hypothetical protein
MPSGTTQTLWHGTFLGTGVSWLMNLIHDLLVSVGVRPARVRQDAARMRTLSPSPRRPFVFEEFMGIPAHPLLVHAAVVFVPLLILVGFGYALVPALRRYLWWAAILLAIGAPGAAFIAKLSGDAFRARLVRNDMATPEGLADIDAHRAFGTNLVYAALALGVLVVVLVLMTRPSRDPDAPARSFSAASIALTVAVLAAGGAAGYYVFQAGDTGANMVWGTM